MRSWRACNGRIRRTRERLLERFEWSIEDFKDALEGPLEAINPVRFAGRLDPDRVLMIEAAEDTCIPAVRQRAILARHGAPGTRRVSV